MATERRDTELPRSEIPIGTVVSSYLPWDRFAREVGDDQPELFNQETSRWVLADGRHPIGLSSLGRRHGVEMAPDLRGVFLRGVNLDRDAGTGDPEGSARRVGSYQVDKFAAHTHPTFGTDDSDVQPGQTQHNGNYLTKGRHSYQTGSAGEGSETRPKNVAVFFYIKINSS